MSRGAGLWKSWAVGLVGAILAAGQVAAGEAVLATQLIASPRVLVIAHRGDSKAAPENTLPAFESAVRAGSDLIELDYVHTQDGVPIVLHDYTLDRTTDAVTLFGEKEIYASAKPLAELQRLDAGSWFHAKFKETRLPTLEEALATIQDGSMTLIERKAGDAQTCVELLARKSLTPHVVVQAFDWKFLADCHELEPNLVLGALGVGELTEERFNTIRKTGAKVIGWEAKSVTPELIDRVHREGFRLWAWTIDNVDRAEELAKAGIDGIITNVPARVKSRLGELESAAR